MLGGEVKMGRGGLGGLCSLGKHRSEAEVTVYFGWSVNRFGLGRKSKLKLKPKAELFRFKNRNRTDKPKNRYFSLVSARFNLIISLRFKCAHPNRRVGRRVSCIVVRTWRRRGQRQALLASSRELEPITDVAVVDIIRLCS